MVTVEENLRKVAELELEEDYIYFLPVLHGENKMKQFADRSRLQ